MSSFSRTCLCDCGRSTATFVTWLDNYSHTFHRSVPRVSKKDYKEMLWAVEARLVSVSVVDFTLVYDANNDVVPVMPRNILSRTQLMQSFPVFVRPHADCLMSGNAMSGTSQHLLPISVTLVCSLSRDNMSEMCPNFALDLPQ